MKRLPNYSANWNLVLILAATVLSLTAFYGFAYIIAIYFAVAIIKFSKTFSTIFGRTVLSLMILIAVIMFAGIVSWIIGIQTYPIIPLLLFGLLLLCYKSYSEKDVSSPKFVDRGDVVSIVLSLAAPLVVLVSFQLPNPSHSATYQFLHNGWDNASHILMLETASLEKGYVYGYYDDVKEKTIQKFNAYPQGWHLANSNLFNGFGTNLFNPSNPILTLSVYTVVLMLWSALSVYTFTRASWAALSLLVTRIKSHNKAAVTALFIVASLIIVTDIHWRGLTSAFANYISMLAYFSVLIAMVIDKSQLNRKSALTTASVAGGGAALSWFLPLPAIGLTIIMAFLLAHITNKKPFSNLIAHINKTPLLILLISITMVVVQIAIFIIFSHVSGSEQLNTGRLLGNISSTQIFYLALFFFTLTVWFVISGKKHIDRVVSSIVPIAIFASSLYAYQILTSGNLSYYFSKILDLSIAATGIFFIPAFVSIILQLRRYTASYLSISLVGLASIGVLMLGTGNSITNIRMLLQRNSLITEEVSREVVRHIIEDDQDKTKLVLLRHSPPKSDVGGNLSQKVPHIPLTCAHTVSVKSVEDNLEAKIDRLDKCADELDKKLIVITSDETKSLVEDLDKPNIQIVNIP